MKNFKERYFAQYWGQEVAFARSANKGLIKTFIRESTPFSCIEFIELTPLSAITDEHAIEVASSLEPIAFRKRQTAVRWAKMYLKDNSTLTVTINTAVKIVDYLRSKGYALPYGGKSVEELIKLGYLKIKG